MPIASEKHHVPTRIENFLVSKWSINISWSSCRRGVHCWRDCAERERRACSRVDRVGQGLAPIPRRAVVDVLAKNGKRPSSALRLHLSRAQNNGQKPFLPSCFFLPSTSHRVSLISPQTDQNPLEHRPTTILLVLPLYLSLLSTLYIPKTATAAVDEHQDLNQRPYWDCILKYCLKRANTIRARLVLLLYLRFDLPKRKKGPVSSCHFIKKAYYNFFFFLINMVARVFTCRMQVATEGAILGWIPVVLCTTPAYCPSSRLLTGKNKPRVNKLVWCVCGLGENKPY